MRPERPVIEIELVFDLVVNGLRNADGAGLGESLEPGGDVDAIAEDVVAVDDDVATIGTANRACAITMAVGVKSKPRNPSGPACEKRR